MTSSFYREKCAVIGSTKERDRASLAIHNRGSQPSTLSSRLSGARSYLGREVSRITITDLELMTLSAELELVEEVTEHNVQIIVSHLQVMEAQVILDLTVYAGRSQGTFT